jgi:hypothetical protein
VTEEMYEEGLPDHDPRAEAAADELTLHNTSIKAFRNRNLLLGRSAVQLLINF